MHDGEIVAERPPEQFPGGFYLPLAEQPADAGAAHPLAPPQHGGDDVHLDPARRAKGLEHRHVPRGAPAEPVVVTAADDRRAEPPHEHLVDEFLRRHIGKIGEVGGEQQPHPPLFEHAGLFRLGDELAVVAFAGGMPAVDRKGEDAGDEPRLPGPFDGAADHRRVPDVQPVEKAAGDGRTAGRGRLGDRVKDLQGLHLQRKKFHHPEFPVFHFRDPEEGVLPQIDREGALPPGAGDARRVEAHAV